MNILFLSNWFPYPPDNGARQRVYQLLRGLARAHQVTLIAFYDSEQVLKDATELDALTTQCFVLPRRVFQPHRLTALAGFFSSAPRFLVDTFDPAMDALITSQVAAKHFDVVVASELSMAPYAAARQGVKKIFEEFQAGVFQDAYVQAHGRARARNWLTWFKFNKYARRLLPQFDAVTVVSEQERARVNTMGAAPQHLAIVPNGVDCDASAQYQEPRAPFSLVYNGAVTYSANLDAMRYFTREILPLIRASEPRVRLQITGRAPEFAINELSQDNVTSFTGYVQDIRAVVQQSAVCVVPLRQGGGTRLKILEAMALGTPVVSTSKGAEGLGLHSGDHLLIADSPHAFADATLRLLRDELLRERLTRAARRLVCSEYDWRVVQAKFERVLVKVTREN